MIVLNEVDGQSFTRLRVGERILHDVEISSWQAVPFEAILESPSLDLGISLSPGSGRDIWPCRVYCGREVSLGLDWAGFAVMSKETVVDYQVLFHA